MRALREFLLAPPGPAGPVDAAGAGVGRRHGPGPRGGGGARRSAGSDGAVAARRGLSRALTGLVLRPPESAAPDGSVGLSAMFKREASAGALAVLCAAEDARAVAVAAAVVLARRRRAACAVACVWTAPEVHRHPDARPPAGRAARRLAAVLSARGLDALACGRVAVIALPSDPAEAVACAGRAGAAAGAAPAVLVLGGPRAAAFDDLLAAQDRVLVVTRPGAADTIAPLALAGLPAGGPPHETFAVALGPLGRALAAGGVAVPSALRRALDGREVGRP
jgi:hypothetical protein